ITTRAAFDNAIAGVAATGGSTNAVLHLLALAREIGVPLTIDDFNPVSGRTPLWADLKPGGRFTAVDLGRAGGAGVVAKRLVAAGLVDGGALTPSGRTLAEETARAVEAPGQEVIAPLERPLKPTGGLVILKGNLAPEAAVGGRIAAVEEGDTIAFDVDKRRLDLLVDEAVIRQRLACWRPPAPRYTSGVFARYVALVSSAAEGAVLRAGGAAG